MIDFTSFSSVNIQKVVSNLKSSPALPFSDVLQVKEISQKMQALNYRERVFTPEVTLWTFLSQVMDADQSQQAAVARVVASSIANGIKEPSINTSAYSQARSRLPEGLLARLTQAVATKLTTDSPGEWRWHGHMIKLVDGSTISMPDTAANQAVYSQPNTQMDGVGFPIARIVVVVDYITGAVMDLAIGAFSGKETGEHALFRQIISSVASGEVLLGDRYYPSYFLMATLIHLGIHGVFQIHSSRKYDFAKGIFLGDKDHIVKWDKPVKPKWMDQNEYDSFPAQISIRELEIENQRPGFRSEKKVLVTTFLNSIITSKADLANLYDYRWLVEISLRDIKTTMRMDILRCKTPDMVRKEIWVHLLAYNLIRRIMAQAAFVHGKLPRGLSFKLALQTINAFQHTGILNNGNNHEVGQKLLDAIAHKKVGNRPGRREPRHIKRRPKAFPLLQKPRGMYRDAA